MDNRLKKFREEQSVTQAKLARKAGVTRQTIISLENGRYNPSLELAFKLSRLFQCSIEELFIYKEDENE